MDIRYLILCLTTRCNLACSYCYQGGAPEGIDMSDEVLSESLRIATSGTASLHVQLTGGEPTLVPELMSRAVRAVCKSPRPTTIAVQTNGTLLTPELVDFLNQYRVQVGISLDGPPAVQERLRGRAADTLKGLALLERQEVPFRVTTVVSRENADQLDRVVLALAGYRSARGIGLDLLVNKGRAKSGLEPADPSDLQKGVSAMLEALPVVNARRRHPLLLRELELLRHRPPNNPARVFCRAAQGRSLAVHPDGRLFSCSQCLGDNRFAAGSVWNPVPENLIRLTGHQLFSETCRTCPVKDACPGDCPSRIYHNPPRDRMLACRLYRTLWENELRPSGRSAQGNMDTG